MVYLEKTQPAPACLELEKGKNNGDYKCDNVLARLKTDFKNKCYICEYKEPISINVEHFHSHEGNQDLKFDWSNLFWSCAHCNNIKLAKYNGILNCTNLTHYVDLKLKYSFKPFPCEKVKIDALVNVPEVVRTKELLEEVYNGTTKFKMIESANLRNKLLDEIMSFQQCLCDYFKANSNDSKTYFLHKIKDHLSIGSNFTAFKRWIVYDNETFYEEFGQYFD